MQTSTKNSGVFYIITLWLIGITRWGGFEIILGQTIRDDGQDMFFFSCLLVVQEKLLFNIEP